MEKVEWIKTKVNMDSIDWNGKPIRLVDVPAIKNSKTGKIRIYPTDVSRAEFRMLAQKYSLEPRDIALLSMLCAKPGPFKEGEVHFKYHLNKMLFYQWKRMEEIGLGETYPHDDFRPDRRGPVPNNLNNDLQRLKELSLVILERKQWGDSEKDASVKTDLTEKGQQLTEKIWKEIPEPFKEVTLKVKSNLFPLNPKTIRERVHRDYPEFQKTYTELDTD